MLLQMTNPNPVPVFFVVNIGSKILSKYSSGIPELLDCVLFQSDFFSIDF